jgi:hypothetical protein
LRPILSPDKITWIDLVNELVHASNDMDFGDIRIVSNEVVHFLIDTRADREVGFKVSKSVFWRNSTQDRCVLAFL